MTNRPLWQLSIGALVAIPLCVSPVSGQADQSALARQLTEAETAPQRREALERIRGVHPQTMRRELRAALIAALDREGKRLVDRHNRDARGEFVEDHEDPTFITDVARVVADMRDPAAISALAGALGTGFIVINGLAAFGAEAVPTLVDVVTSPNSIHDAVDHGLIALRFVVENTPSRPLTPAARASVRRAADQRLKSGKGLDITTLWWAIDLAVVLNDPGLRQRVERLATDWNAVEATGIRDVELGQQTQKRAADRLAGVPPLPRP
jgi:hypothetical protein